MGFVKLSGDFLKKSFIPVEEIFIRDYLPEADATDVKVYLYGLSCAMQGDFSLSQTAEKLQLSEERIRKSFEYWEEKSLVSISPSEPFSVTYLAVREPEPAVIKFHAEKYKSFVEEAARIYPERLLMPNDLNSYMELMHTEKMETNAMLLVMQYCKDLGGGRTGTKYVCAVARAWAREGYLTEKQVADHISDLENNNEEIRKLFEALGVKRAADVEDRQMYYKWKGYGFPVDAILTAARSRKKKGGMEKLDLFMEELRKASAITAVEVAEYAKNKEKIHELAVEICKNLGVYYSNTENIVEIYVLPWLGKGFDSDALLRISRYCFLRNVHTLDVMQSMVDKIAGLGLFTEGEIRAYVERQIELDGKIRAVYNACGYVGSVTNRDRESYKNWIEWGFAEETIIEVGKRFCGTAFPMQQMARTFGSLHAAGTTDLDAALASLQKPEAKKVSQVNDYMQHNYSEKMLKDALVNFDEWSDE